MNSTAVINLSERKEKRERMRDFTIPQYSIFQFRTEDAHMKIEHALEMYQ
jgi:hypothetical protein